MARYCMGILAVAALIVVMGGCAKKQSQPQFVNMDAVYVKYDTNHDGVITKEEFMAQWQDKQKAETAWKKIDMKNNGFVDQVINNDAPVSVWNAVSSDNNQY